MSGKTASGAEHLVASGTEVIAAGCERIEVPPRRPAMTQLEQKRLKHYVSELAIHEGLAIRLLYGLGCEPLQIGEVAALLGVSEPVVGLLEEMALEHLRVRYGLSEPAAEEPAHISTARTRR